MNEVVERLNNANPQDKTLVSFEFYPPKTEKGVTTLQKRIRDKFTSQSPAYIDFTWGAGGSTSDLTMELSKNARDQGLLVNMHLTCTNMPKELVDRALCDARAAGIDSICALRGDPPLGQDAWVPTEGGFTCALDLVRYIRQQHGDYFTISVSGYPEGHPTTIKPASDALSPSELSRLVYVDGAAHVCHDQDFAKEIQYLKLKVDAGANFIITQLFYDVVVFTSFVEACRAAGILCPILPGVMPIVKLGPFKRMTSFCKTRIPSDLQGVLDAAEQSGEEDLFTQGVDYVVDMCTSLLELGTPALHFYTLNSEKASFAILERLSMLVT